MNCVMKESKLPRIRLNTARAMVILTSVLTVVILGARALRVDAIPTFSTAAPTGYDPLTAQEVDAVVAAALQAEGEEALHAAASGVQEVLLVERHEAPKAAYTSGSWPRRGDVYLYDYATDTLIFTTVDVQSGVVVTTERVQGVQLPLAQREAERALALVQADGPLWMTLAARYQAITGEPLTHIDQLQRKVSVFHADVMPDRLNAAAQRCGLHRCAQVLLFTTDKTLLALTPIVDLSRGEVVQVLGEE